MKKKRVGVVGGGLAGLTAAYRVLQAGTHTVDIYESRPYIGGRVQSRAVLNRMVDFGGFLIYPWYTHTHRLFHDLDIADGVVKTPPCDVLYILDETGDAKREEDITFPIQDGMRIWSTSLLKLLGKTPLSAPDLSRFHGQTISEYLRQVLKTRNPSTAYEVFFDTVNQGYCYGPVTKTKAAFMMPIVRQVKFHGDIRTTSFFPDGTCALIERLHQNILALGGRIHTNTHIARANGTMLSTDTETFAHDTVIFAQHVSADVYRSILPDVNPECWYTQFLTVAVQLAEIPHVHTAQTWGALFYAPHEAMTPQTLSVINLVSMHGNDLAGCIMMNIVLRRNTTRVLSSARINQIVRKEVRRLFPSVSLKQVLESVHWTHTMPVAQESFVQAVRDHHGKNGQYFAGDFLGAPSIETAIATGNAAARDLLRAQE